MTAFPIPNLPELAKIPPGLLYPHQSDGVAFQLSKKRGVLADDMGLGKTLQTLVFLSWLRERRQRQDRDQGGEKEHAHGGPR